MSDALATLQRGPAAHGRAGGELVLIHGWALNLAVWDTTVAALSANHHCIAIDLPGHGHSTWCAEDGDFDHQLERIEDTLPREPCSLIGWSLGGLFALALAARRPERVHRLVLVATLPRFLAFAGWPHGLSAESLSKFAMQLSANYRGTVSDFLDLQTRGSTNAGATRAELGAALRERGEAQPSALTAGLGFLQHVDLRTELPEIRCPTLAIAGQYDRICAPAGMQAMANALKPHAVFRSLSRAAHAPFLSHSQLFVSEVAKFLDDR